MRITLAFFLVAQVAMSAAGCGEEGVVGRPEPLTKADYVAKLGEIGEPLERAIADSVESNFDSPGTEELAAIGDDTASALELLVPPEEVKDVHERLVGGVRDWAQDLRELARAEEQSETVPPLDAIACSPSLRRAKHLSGRCASWRRAATTYLRALADRPRDLGARASADRGATSAGP